MLPFDTKEQIDNYVKYRVPPGGFLYAILSNNFMDVVMKADDRNIRCLVDIARYLYNDTPCDCWGSIENVENWLKGR